MADSAVARLRRRSRDERHPDSYPVRMSILDFDRSSEYLQDAQSYGRAKTEILARDYRIADREHIEESRQRGFRDGVPAAFNSDQDELRLRGAGDTHGPPGSENFTAVSSRACNASTNRSSAARTKAPPHDSFVSALKEGRLTEENVRPYEQLRQLAPPQALPSIFPS